MRDQIARADALYEQGCAGISQLRHGRRAVAAAAVMYREILRQIEREGYGAAPAGRSFPARASCCSRPGAACSRDSRAAKVTTLMNREMGCGGLRRRSCSAV